MNGETAGIGEAVTLPVPLQDRLDELRAAAGALTGSPQDAEELVQETLAAATAGLAGLRNREVLDAWLLQILRRKWIDELRRRARERQALDAQRPGAAAPSDPELVLRALASLGDEERRVVELRYFQSMNSPEIARVLGKPPGTVRSMLFHALNRIEAAYRRLSEDA